MNEEPTKKPRGRRGAMRPGATWVSKRKVDGPGAGRPLGSGQWRGKHTVAIRVPEEMAGFIKEALAWIRANKLADEAKELEKLLLEEKARQSGPRNIAELVEQAGDRPLIIETMTPNGYIALEPPFDVLIDQCEKAFDSQAAMDAADVKALERMTQMLKEPVVFPNGMGETVQQVDKPTTEVVPLPDDDLQPWERALAQEIEGGAK